MAQIIKHRRGSIGSLKSTTARNAELIIASGSISDLSGPFVFIGSPNSGDEGIAGAFNTVSKLYTGTNAPTITAATYGSGLDGTPYYASGDKSLYILNNSNIGNTKIDLSGNIEGNTISGVTINALTASFVSASNTVSATTGSFGQINVSSIAFTGLTEGRVSLVGPGGSIVDSGSLNFNNGQLGITGSIKLNDNSSIYNDGALFVEDNTNGVTIQSNNYAELQSSNAWVWVEGSNAYVEGSSYTKVSTDSGNVDISSYDGGTLNLNTDGGEGLVRIGNGGNNLEINSDTITISGSNSTKIGQNNDTAHFYTSNQYAEMYGGSGIDVYTNGGNLWVYNNSGNVDVSSYSGGTLNLNTDGGEGDVWVLNGTNKININGWSNFTGSVNISGDTSVTGSLVVTDGAAFIDQGVVAQNSNVLLTSGSSLIIQDGGNANIAGNVYITGSESVDYIYGRTQQWNYLAFNGGAVGAPGVELSSAGNISLWAEGGYINVTGSMNVTGDIIFSGSINIGDNIGVDTINFQGEVSSSILPKVNNAFDLGSIDNNWRDLFVSGTAHVGTLEAGSISLSGITVFNDLQVSGSIYNFTLSPTDVVFVDGDQRLTGSAAFTYAYNPDYGDYVLEAPIIRASNDGNGTNFLIGNDMWLGDVNEGNATRFMGNEDNNVAKIYLGNNSTNNYLEANYGNTRLSTDGTLYLESQNSQIRLNSYGGATKINNDSNSNVQIYGDTYIYNHNLYVDRIWDNEAGENYLELFGSNTNNGYWWESGTGYDTTLLNNMNSANLNILQRNGGKVNIDAPSVNIHTTNGMNVTGSLVVSDASGVFNSSLIVNNSDLTLDGGTNQHMNDGAHLYFDTCVDMYYDSGDGNFIFYNDCNNFQFRNNVSITGSVNISGGIYTDNIWGKTYNSNVLRLNGGSYGAPDVEIASQGQISLFSEGSGTNFAINMTGSVHMSNNLDVSGSVYLGQIYNYNSNINGGAIYIDSSDYTEISHNDGDAFFGVDGGGIYGTSNVGVTVLNSNAGDTTINANNGYNVNINANNILLNGDTAVTGALSVSSDLTMDGNLYVSGNLEVLGSSTNVHLESHTVNIGDNIILVNAYSPFQRYAGLAAYDSGSSGVSGSLLWDSLNDYWMFVSASGQSSKLVGTTAGTYGSEVNLTSGTIPIATGNNNIGDSLLTYSGTTLAYNTNKFTIDSGTGETYISGNVTLNSGASDLGSKTSGIVFRNDDDVLGFVSATETTDVMDGVLGYRSSDGVLVFSTVIDGGVY